MDSTFEDGIHSRFDLQRSANATLADSWSKRVRHWRAITVC